MAKHQKKMTLQSVAARRNQTLTQLVTDWGVKSLDGLAKRCKSEDVAMPTDFTFTVSVAKVVKDQIQASELPKPVKSALVELQKESEDVSGKKVKKSKLTLDEPSPTSDEHSRVDAHTAARPKDPT